MWPYTIYIYIRLLGIILPNSIILQQSFSLVRSLLNLLVSFRQVYYTNKDIGISIVNIQWRLPSRTLDFLNKFNNILVYHARQPLLNIYYRDIYILISIIPKRHEQIEAYYKYNITLLGLQIRITIVIVYFRLLAYKIYKVERF